MIDRTRFPLLAEIDSPADLRALPEAALSGLARELREFLLHSVSQSGGHLAANLGVIELTLALHYVYATPDDRLVWDVGHQAYPHKILTGRRDRMDSIRQRDGLAGFPKRGESEHDAFGVGHSSTSISAALGMALAARHTGSDRRAVAIIGDGAMTAGMAFEALNHAGDIHANLLVVLNDNEMSISPNVGALSKQFGRMLGSRLYTTVREGGKRALDHAGPLRELAKRAEEHVKGMVVPGTLFEELGFNYIGPVDGHDLHDLIRTLRTLRDLNGPHLLHIKTRKGKGFGPAEADPCTYHGVGSFDPETGEIAKGGAHSRTYTEVFGDWLCDMAAQDARLVGITPAMREGSGLVRFARQFPNRYFDVGIAEQHAVTVAAGMACDGVKPVVAIYSTFLQRAYDQLIHDVALQDLDVLFAIDRAGLVGADGPTHAGAFDLSYLRCIPNMLVMTPSDEAECRRMLTTGFLHPGPAAVRYPRGAGPGMDLDTELEVIEIGKARVIRQGQHVAILAFGSLLAAAREAGEELDATVVDMRFVKPLDEDMIRKVSASHDLLITVEENAVAGGAGSAVNEFLAAQGIRTPIGNFGLPDRFIDHGAHSSLLADCGLDAKGIVAQIKGLGHTESAP
ncbi:MAG: 1-deoxy-D-xylulose-5-phosphate synthase [Gammaproteobacteria bacterium]|nr:1-deoxy-D-xylulose-5-phosphate synthase [Gammaproteobacteria bacterium]